MDQAIIIAEDIGFVPVGRPVGRPRSNAKFCKECGIELDFCNARETKKGSGSLRSTCRSCESSRSSARYKARTITKPQKIKKRISRGPVFVERPNLIGMAVQSVICRENEEGSPRHHHITFYLEDALCDECGGKIRYDKHLTRVCESCGLIGDQVIYGFLDMEFAGRTFTSREKSKYDIKFLLNRDGEIDKQRAKNRNTVFNSYEPAIAVGTYSPEYKKYYRKSLDVGKVPDYYERISKIK